jgi:hypothetical protein
MKSRIVVAGLAGGVAIFLWGFVAHMFLPLGEAGMRSLPYQDKVLPALSASLKEPGLYIFPWPESSPGTPMPMTQQAQQAAAELYKTSPHGLLLFHPPPAAMMTGGQLLREFLTNCASSLIAAALVSLVIGALGSYRSRVLFVTMIGVSAVIAVNVPYWNWYEFPAAFTMAEIVEHIVGFFVAGLVIAAIIKPVAVPAVVRDQISTGERVERSRE